MKNWAYYSVKGFPGGAEVKASACNVGDLGLIPGSGRSSGEGNGNPLQYSWPGKCHGQRSIVGYSPWDRKELDMTERLHFTSLLYFYLLNLFTLNVEHLGY